MQELILTEHLGGAPVNANEEFQRREPVAGDPHLALRLWLRMLSCTTHIEKKVNRRFRATFGISLARFDYMAQLYRHPGGLRMNELTRLLMVTGGNVTGLTDEMVRERFVERLPDPDDRRVSRLRLTEGGERIFRDMAAAHEQWILEVMQGLEEQEMLETCSSLGRLRARLNL